MFEKTEKKNVTEEAWSRNVSGCIVMGWRKLYKPGKMGILIILRVLMHLGRGAITLQAAPAVIAPRNVLCLPSSPDGPRILINLSDEIAKFSAARWLMGPSFSQLEMFPVSSSQTNWIDQGYSHPKIFVEPLSCGLQLSTPPYAAPPCLSSQNWELCEWQSTRVTRAPFALPVTQHRV